MSSCKVVDTMPSVMDEFATVVDTPFQISPKMIEVALDFVCRLYVYCNEPNNDVDFVRMMLIVLTED